jgi:tRNA(Ile)-lysidine synthetase-like protein
MNPADADPGRLDEAVDRFFAGPGAPWATRPGVVAFSGGPDSTALLACLAGCARRRGPALTAAHLDHGLDPGSAGRALRAAELADALGVPLDLHRLPDGTAGRDGGEAAARRHRYRFLAGVARRRGAGWVATAHHRDDQAETVVLRLLFGSGAAGLAAIRPVATLTPELALLRPLLDLPRRALAAAATGLGAVADPTNDDLAVPRNRVRHRLLPLLARDEGLTGDELARRLAGLATAAREGMAAAEARLARHLGLTAAAPPGPGWAAVDLDRLAALPDELLALALGLLHRAAGAPYPAGAAARSELRRQLVNRRKRGTAVGCDGGRGWRLAGEGRRLALRPSRPRGGPTAFSYTLTVPGEVELPESGFRLRVERRPPAPWMVRGAPLRAGLALPLAPGDTVVVRSRRAGDRLRPLGAAGTRRLKDLLIDHRVPLHDRDRLPLLCLGAGGGSIAWVPGVTVAEACRIPARGAAPVWVAELAPVAGSGNGPSPLPEDGIGGTGEPLVETR